MIQRLDIKKYGSYEEFKWRKGDEKFEFKKLNIIYGHNYSGKTTLSRIFHTLETRKQHKDYSDGEYEFSFEGNLKLSSNNIESLDSQYIVRVFNSDFITENLSWFHNIDGSIQPFTVLGSSNVEIEKEIQQLELILNNDEAKTGYEYELKELEKTKNSKEAACNELRGSISTSLTEFARNVRGKQKIYARNPYTKTHLESDIYQANKVLVIGEAEREKMLKQLDERELSRISFIRLEYESLKNAIHKSIEALHKTINISEALNELVINDLIKKWLIEGVDIHEEAHEVCQMCGSPFPEGRWNQLKSYFNNESKELRDNLSSMIGEFNKLIESLENHFILKKADFYIIYQDDYLKVYEKWNKQKDIVVGQLRELVGLLEEKKTKETEVLSFELNSDIINKLAKIDDEIESIIIKNNAKTTSLKNDKLSIHKKLLQSDIKGFLVESCYESKQKELKVLEREMKDAIKRFDEKNKEIEAIKEKIELKRSQEMDESKGADRVNHYLNIFFGSNEIQLIPIVRNDLTSYEIRRNNMPAKNLSDGECSLISFCYFISKVEDLLINPVKLMGEGSVAGPPTHINKKIIIYIDDPISSLDNNHVFFVYSIIEEKIAKQNNLHQLFISTHNLDFLKYLKRISGINEEKAYFFIEKNKKGELSKSRIVSMPYHLKEYVTEFNYLFQQMYDVYKPISGKRIKVAENCYTNFYSLPNNIRKFLELYTFYRFPTNDAFMKRLEMMFDGHVPILINRIVNEFSHLTYIERAWKPFEIPELEEVVKIIFEKMKEIDEKQYQVLIDTCF